MVSRDEILLKGIDVNASVSPIGQQSGGDAVHFAPKLIAPAKSLDGTVMGDSVSSAIHHFSLRIRLHAFWFLSIAARSPSLCCNGPGGSSRLAASFVAT